MVELHSLIQGTGFPILCIHGHPGSGRCMSVFTRHLSCQFKTIAPDLRGYGRSRTHQPFTLGDHLLDLEKLLTQLQLDQCLILGWSLGGILALELALRFPERVTGLILVASAAYPRGNHPPVTWQDNVLTGVAGIINLIFPGWQWNIKTLGQRSLFRYLIQQHTPQTYQYLAREGTPAYLQTSAFATSALNTALKSRYNRLEQLSEIKCPCLVLAGAKDRHITAESSLETAHHLQKSQFHSYPKTAHLFPWEVPTEVLADIDQWISQHPQVVGRIIAKN